MVTLVTLLQQLRQTLPPVSLRDQSWLNELKPITNPIDTDEFETDTVSQETDYELSPALYDEQFLNKIQNLADISEENSRSSPVMPFISPTTTIDWSPAQTLLRST